MTSFSSFFGQQISPFFGENKSRRGDRNSGTVAGGAVA
jgi:hypothetical protein